MDGKNDVSSLTQRATFFCTSRYNRFKGRRRWFIRCVVGSMGPQLSRKTWYENKSTRLPTFHVTYNSSRGKQNPGGTQQLGQALCLRLSGVVHIARNACVVCGWCTMRVLTPSFVLSVIFAKTQKRKAPNARNIDIYLLFHLFLFTPPAFHPSTKSLHSGSTLSENLRNTWCGWRSPRRMHSCNLRILLFSQVHHTVHPQVSNSAPPQPRRSIL